MDTIDVLLIEDNPVDVLTFREELEETEGVSFAITHVESLHQAEERLGRDDFHIVVLDLGLSDSQGLETFRSIRSATLDVPVIVMSGVDDEIVAVDAVREGAQDYLVKGNFSGDTLRRSIRYAMERHLLMAQVKQGEEALRRSEERFRAIFDGASDAIWIKNKTRQVTHVNPATVNILQRSRDAMRGLQTGDPLDPQSETGKEIDARVLSGESVEEERTIFIAGEPTMWNIVRSPLRDGSGEIVGLCGIAREITDRRRIEPKPRSIPENYRSKTMQAALHQARLAARTQSCVLLLGESGAGKDYLARYIHDHSPRATGPYFAINCAAIPSDLAESELFGHARGAFTGAVAGKRGLLELAEGGTLLLNEIGDLPLPLQAKLLTFLDTRKFTRVGGEKETSVNARLIAATNRDLQEAVGAGQFRQDLFFRLNVMAISVPPLRDRVQDIPILVQDILARLATELQIHEVTLVDQATLQALQRYDWPGNVRELRNVLERALMLSGGKSIDGNTVQITCSTEPTVVDKSFSIAFEDGVTLQDATDEIARMFCIEALKRSGGNKKTAARLLGISRDTLYRYLQKFAIDGA